MRLLLLLLLLSSPVYAYTHYEREYINSWCSANNGIAEYRLDDRCRIDCLTKEYAIEFEFPYKWKESIGQSLYYAYKTNRKPAIILIKPDKSTLDKLRAIAEPIGIKVWTIGF